jgi:hypothetical protein
MDYWNYDLNYDHFYKTKEKAINFILSKDRYFHF